jgi:hypothetical protein
MSCSLTIDAVRARTKTVTRRHVDTWTTLRPGDRLTLVEKAMGLPKGARQVVLATVEIVSVDVRPLRPMTYDELEREGFDVDDPFGMTIDEFYLMWLTSHGYDRPSPTRLAFEAEVTPCRRIEWRYLDEVAP